MAKKTAPDRRLFRGHIIAILAAILFPVFARAREKARQSSCLSNVKQISLAMLMYAQDYDERFVFLYQSATTPRTGLAQLIQPYIGNWQVNDCPSSDGVTTNNYLNHRSYGYNTRLIPANAGGRMLAEIKRPAEIVLMGDVCQDPNARGRFHPPTSGPFMCEPDGSNCQICGGRHNSMYATGHANAYDRPGFNFLERHNGTGNVGFCDGHAKAMKHTDLYRGGSNTPYFDYEN